MLWVLLAVCLFYWKILFTRQFSLLTDYESANQAYSWYHFSAATVQHGSLPLWDPYVQAGRSFAGEMQTGLFYPPKLLLYLAPLNRAGLFSPQGFHFFHVLTHFVGACFLFLLAREMGLSGFPSFFAALCFSLGGFVGRVGWPNMLDSAIWLPAAFFLMLRALRAPDSRRGLAYAAWSGLAHSFAILAGSLHVALMNSLILAGAALYHGFRDHSAPRLRRRWCLTVLLTLAIVSAAGASLQLLPSMEYSHRAVRFLGNIPPLPATHKIPYGDMSEAFWPRSLLSFLIGGAFQGSSIGSGEVSSPYMGVLPFLLALAGVWQNWERPWARYLTVMGGLAFFYSLGTYSLLHGLVYALVPVVWMAREGGRFIYCTHFALALLAGFGLHTVLEERQALLRHWAFVGKALKSLAFGSAAALCIPALYAKLDVNEWSYASFLFVLTSCGALALLLRGGSTPGRRLLLVAVLLCDLSAFQWNIRDVREEDRQGRNSLTVLLKSRPLARFLERQPGLFRVHFEADWEPSVGDLYGISTTAGKSATMLESYLRFRDEVPRSLDLLNVRYFIRPRTAAEPGAVYQDDMWKVYENPSVLPRAWVATHRVSRVTQAGFDASTTAVVAEPLPFLNGDALQPAMEPASVAARVIWIGYEANRLELSVTSARPGLLVLSEMDYPGWEALVNSRPERIYRVDGALRGVVIPQGRSQVVFRYAPRWFLPGVTLTAAAFLGCLALSWLAFRRESQVMKPQPELIEQWRKGSGLPVAGLPISDVLVSSGESDDGVVRRSP